MAACASLCSPFEEALSLLAPPTEVELSPPWATVSPAPAWCAPPSSPITYAPHGMAAATGALVAVSGEASVGMLAAPSSPASLPPSLPSSTSVTEELRASSKVELRRCESPLELRRCAADTACWRGHAPLDVRVTTNSVVAAAGAALATQACKIADSMIPDASVLWSGELGVTYHAQTIITR